MRILLLTLACCAVLPSLAQKQFTLSGEYRPRAEYRHGYSNLPVTGQETAFFIDQRSRINLDYQSERYDIKIVLQDVRTWGNQPQLVANDGSLTTLHEGWANYKFNNKFSAKIGRQEIWYNDHRIFGNVGWAQQARSHDALLLKYNNDGLRIDLGFAYNQDGPQLSTNFYSVPRSYKAFQYLWIDKNFNDFNASLLFLNLGNQGGTSTDPKTYYAQTLGGRLTYKKEALNSNFAFYSQFGDQSNNINVSALLYSIDLAYTLSKKHTVLVGYEHISGNDQINPSITENQAFNPYFGTNHKFNGLMDYFYVGNHIGNVGLNDFQFGYKGKFSDKLNVGMVAHIFSSDGELLDTVNGGALSKRLGTEIDFTGSYKLSKEVSLAFGYSQMFSTDSMVELKGGDKDETSNWSWLMITFKPTFFTIKKEG